MVKAGINDKQEEQTEEVKSIIDQLSSPESLKIAEAGVSLYRIAEQSNEKKIMLMDREGLLCRLMNLMTDECLSIRRVACMVLASLSAHEVHFSLTLKNFPGFLDFILCYIQTEPDDIIVENCLYLLVNFCQKRLKIKHLLRQGFLLPLMTLACHHDPDVVKHSLHLLVILSKDFEVRRSMVTLGVLERLRVYMESAFVSIRRLLFALLENCVEHCFLRCKFAEEGLLETMADFVKKKKPALQLTEQSQQNQVGEINENNGAKKSRKGTHEETVADGTGTSNNTYDGKSEEEKKRELEDRKLIPHALFIIHNLLRLPSSVKKFLDIGGFEVLLELLEGVADEGVAKSGELAKKENKKEEKKHQKTLSRASSRKNKESGKVEEKVEWEDEAVNELMKKVHLVSGVADCLSLVLVSDNTNQHFCLLQEKNLLDKYFSFFSSSLASSEAFSPQPVLSFQASIISLFAVFATFPQLRSLIAHHDGLKSLLGSCPKGQVSASLSQSLSLLLANLAHECQENCRLLTENETFSMILVLFKCPHEQTLVNTTHFITNLCFHASSRGALHTFPVLPLLVDVLKSQCCQNKNSDLVSNIRTISASRKNLKSREEKHGEAEANVPVTGSSIEDHSAAIQTSFKDSNVLIRGCLMALAGLCVDCEGRRMLMETGELCLMVALLSSPCSEVQTEASLLLCHLAHEKHIAQEICRIGGLRTAFEVDRNAHTRKQTNTLLLNLLFKQNLPAKLAYQGYLADDDKIEDGFIDVGRLKGDVWVEIGKPDDYRLREDATQRPVFLINPFPATISGSTSAASVVTSVVGLPETNKAKGKAGKGVSSTNESVGGNKKVTPKVPPSNVETPADYCSPYVLPVDTLLRELIEKCCSEVLPLATTRHQIVHLAKMVSLRMGGQVFREALHDFEWQEHLAAVVRETGSRVFPLGMVRWGIHHHRALLFKTLADRMELPCSLITCQYSRSFILVSLMENTVYIDDRCKQRNQLVPIRYVVDLVFQPGELIQHPSKKAKDYYSF